MTRMTTKIMHENVVVRFKGYHHHSKILHQKCQTFSVESKVGEWHFALLYVWAVTFKSTQEKWGLLARLCSLHLGKHYKQTKPKLLRKALTLSCAAATENSPWKAAYAIVDVWGPWEHLPTASKSCPARWTMGAYWSMCGKNKSQNILQ